jgi:glycerol-3-phosphate responsive antiterminator
VAIVFDLISSLQTIISQPPTIYNQDGREVSFMCSKSQMTFSQIQNYINNQQNKDKEFILHVDLSIGNQNSEEEYESDYRRK